MSVLRCFVKAIELIIALRNRVRNANRQEQTNTKKISHVFVINF